MVRVSILNPKFIWHKTLTVAEQQKRLHERQGAPQLRSIWPKWFRIVVGRVHRSLILLSRRYCRWYDIPFSGEIAQLPFGLLIKHSDGTRLEEVVAMQAARDAGLPVPFVVSYGEHPDQPHAPVSILMTRMPGEILFKQLWEWLLPEEKQVLVTQLRSFLTATRSWKQDSHQTSSIGSHATTSICSVLGTNIRSVRVPRHTAGPCANEKVLNDELSQFAYSDWTKKSSGARYSEFIEQLEALHALPPHDIVFTHGDLTPHNLLVLPDGRISAILDWEASGWYPEYWEYTTAFGTWPQDEWWPKLVAAAGGDIYKKHYLGDRVRRMLAPDTMDW